MKHSSPATFAGGFEVKGGNSAPDLKAAQTDEADEIVTKALADFQKAVDDRLKAVEAKQAEGKEVETKQADADKIAARLDKMEAALNRPAVHTKGENAEADLETKAFIDFARRGVERMACSPSRPSCGGASDMRAGKLDRTIYIERETETVSPSGAVVTAWTNIATARAEIVQQSASEFFTGYGEAETGTVVFRVRYLAGITTADRITYAGSTYNIKEVVEIGRRRGLELRAVATA